ncbi:polyprenol phosphomannose-dependent alpha 1,6 mannosyltransferase MptB [Lentzea sp. NPDC006480]|uniref:polyprenol phosphomannose-dependent alpha 1,6 mannosyltransferase MptB n=1 Tax=Lentzea sp. NPDC006480 TaxID=3157176 RepID=UPI0033BF515D
MAATPSLLRPSSEVFPPEPSAAVRANLRAIPVRTTALGLLGVTLIALGGMGAGAVPQHDPLFARAGLSWLRYGHGHDLAIMVLYLGLGLVVWAWIKLGRLVRSGEAGDHAVLGAVTAWTVPLLFAPPLFSKDVYSYLAQGQLALSGYDPYQVGPAVLQSALSENVSGVWQHTPAPYGPLFILLAKAIVWLTGGSVVLGVIAMRLSLVGGLVLLCRALPGLSRHLGGKSAIALWLVAANPLLLIHLVGGAHNDLMMIGLMAAGVLLVLDRRHVLGFVLLGLAFAVKATAVVIVPFLVWIWAARLDGDERARVLRGLLPGAVTILGAFLGVFAACTLIAGVGLGWIPALSNSSVIVNWLSVPSGVGAFVGMVASWFADDSASVRSGIFVGVARTLGAVVLIWVAWTQWWAARNGDVRDNLRRGAVTMLAVALLLGCAVRHGHVRSPPTE